ncbi:hypothetical protein PSTT_09804 [Puccinia striiformis]|uniref:Synaptobrevin homolog YKT6 n=1 Tax=Puccinia striiformis TaxID=27350 RepID=A0A2S4V707_9BASI|nr:hypothetical protein PSTT_09804 [Puccinia striiformis]
MPSFYNEEGTWAFFAIYGSIRFIGEFLNFFAKTVAERTATGQRQSVQENNYTAHAYLRPVENLIGIIITNDEYPVRVAFSLLNKLLDEFTTKIPESKWKPILANPPTSGTAPNLGFNSIDEYLIKYQDPKQADTILKVQQELDETKIVLHKTIESVLERGEKLDSLVERSNALSSQSKMFYKTAKKQNTVTPGQWEGHGLEKNPGKGIIQETKN